MEYVDKVKMGAIMINSITKMIEDKCLTPDQAIMQVLNEFDTQLGWDALAIRDCLWGTRHLIDTTLRMLYARHPEIPRNKQDYRTLIRKLAGRRR